MTRVNGRRRVLEVQFEPVGSLRKSQSYKREPTGLNLVPGTRKLLAS